MLQVQRFRELTSLSRNLLCRWGRGPPPRNSPMMKLRCEARLYCPRPRQQSLNCLHPFLLVSKAVTLKKTILRLAATSRRQLILLSGGELGTPGVEWGRMLRLGRARLEGVASILPVESLQLGPTSEVDCRDISASDALLDSILYW